MHASFLFILFAIASQKTECIDWLVTQPRTNFAGKQARSGKSSFRLNWGWWNAQQSNVHLLKFARSFSSSFQQAHLLLDDCPKPVCTVVWWYVEFVVCRMINMSLQSFQKAIAFLTVVRRFHRLLFIVTFCSRSVIVRKQAADQSPEAVFRKPCFTLLLSWVTSASSCSTYTFGFWRYRSRLTTSCCRRCCIRAAASGRPMVPGPPFHVWPPGCCTHPIQCFLNVPPPFWFLAPLLLNPGDGPVLYAIFNGAKQIVSHGRPPLFHFIYKKTEDSFGSQQCCVSTTQSLECKFYRFKNTF